MGRRHYVRMPLSTRSVRLTLILVVAVAGCVAVVCSAVFCFRVAVFTCLCRVCKLLWLLCECMFAAAARRRAGDNPTTCKKNKEKAKTTASTAAATR
jgi:hypothetical protein